MNSNKNSKAFQKLAEAAETIVNPEIQKWKHQGHKVMGYFCSAMPTEMITAAGFLPFRLRAPGSTGTELSDAFFSSINCTFPRHVLNMALKGEYDFIDGLIMFNSCDHIRRVYDHWIRQMDTTFVKILSLPKKAEQPQIEWFAGELTFLREGMQEHFNVDITDEALNQAIKIHNETRRLLRSLYELRKGESPPITGAEMLAITVASTAMPLVQYNRLLREVIDDLNKKEGYTKYRARLMILGGELDNPEYIKVIEDQGGLVVTDSLCFGSRMLWKDVNEDEPDPLKALARYYIAERPSCPRVLGDYAHRSEYTEEMIREFDVDGVILERLTFCDCWGFEQFTINNDFKCQGIPLLMLDREYTLSGLGQLRTRVQAFLETIGR